jgi:DNA-binding transcriptional LysR family regulator
VLAAVQDGVVAVSAVASGDAGTISVALVGTIAGTRLTDRLRAFREAHPAIRLELRTARSDEVSALVQQGDVAIGLRYFADPSSSIVSHLVEEERLLVICAGHSRLAAGVDIEPAALHGVPWITFPTGSGSSGEPYARVVEQQRLRAGLDDAEIIAIDSLTAQKRLIEADFGVGLMPASSVAEELRLGTLAVVQVPALSATVPVVAIHRRTGYLVPAAQRLLTTLVAEVDQPRLDDGPMRS